MKRYSSLLCLLALAGCPLLKTSSSTSTTSPVTSTASPVTSTASSEPMIADPAAAEAGSSRGDYEDPKDPNIGGLSIAEAQKRIKANGFKGEVEVVEMSEFDKDCKAETVCRYSPQRWYLNQDHFMTLYKNRAVAIAVPTDE